MTFEIFCRGSEEEMFDRMIDCKRVHRLLFSSIKCSKLQYGTSTLRMGSFHERGKRLSRGVTHFRCKPSK